MFSDFALFVDGILKKEGKKFLGCGALPNALINIIKHSPFILE